MRRYAFPVLAAALLFAAAPTARAQEPTDITKLFRSAPSSKSLTNADIVAGLKEALEVGTTNTVDLTGQVEGAYVRHVVPESSSGGASATPSPTPSPTVSPTATPDSL